MSATAPAWCQRLNRQLISVHRAQPSIRAMSTAALPRCALPSRDQAPRPNTGLKEARELHLLEAARDEQPGFGSGPCPPAARRDRHRPGSTGTRREAGRGGASAMSSDASECRKRTGACAGEVANARGPKPPPPGLPRIEPGQRHPNVAREAGGIRGRTEEGGGDACDAESADQVDVAYHEGQRIGAAAGCRHRGRRPVKELTSAT